MSFRTAVNVVATSSTIDRVSRHEMLDWINLTLHSHYTKIEEMHRGDAYCQFMDILFPGAFVHILVGMPPGVLLMKKVRWNGRLESDALFNFKLFHTALKAVNIDKVTLFVNLQS